MNPLVDLFLYDIARSRQHELLESARASRVPRAADPTRIGAMLRRLGSRFRRRQIPPSQAAPALEAISHEPHDDGVFCPRFRARSEPALRGGRP